MSMLWFPMTLLLESTNPLAGIHAPSHPDPDPCWLDPLLLGQSDRDSILDSLRHQKAKTCEGLATRDVHRASQSERVSRPRRPSRNYVSREEVSPSRARQLERNRVAANKCRLKKKHENDKMQSILMGETARRDTLVAEISALKEELWHLKNRIFAHANCGDESIKTQLAVMAQHALVASPLIPQCPSPTLSASVHSDKSMARLDSGALEGGYNIADRYGLEDLLDGFIDTTKL